MPFSQVVCPAKAPFFSPTSDHKYADAVVGANARCPICKGGARDLKLSQLPDVRCILDPTQPTRLPAGLIGLEVPWHCNCSASERAGWGY